jgi:hypothetical protein
MNAQSDTHDLFVQGDGVQPHALAVRLIPAHSGRASASEPIDDRTDQSHLGLPQSERCERGRRTVYAGRSEADVVMTSMFPSRRGPVAAVGFPLACIHRFRLRARVGVTVSAPSPPLTDPSVRD